MADLSGIAREAALALPDTHHHAVLADRYLELGDSRGEFIALSIAVAHLSTTARGPQPCDVCMRGSARRWLARAHDPADPEPTEEPRTPLLTIAMQGEQQIALMEQLMASESREYFIHAFDGRPMKDSELGLPPGTLAGVLATAMGRLTFRTSVPSSATTRKRHLLVDGSPWKVLARVPGSRCARRPAGRTATASKECYGCALTTTSLPGPGRLVAYLSVFVGTALAINGVIFATGAIKWSRTLKNPSWSPPGPVIGTVWVVLFALMAGAAFIVDRRAAPSRAKPARLAIIAQWTLNMSWTVLYFGLRNVPNGFFVTVAAWLLCLVTITFTVRAAKLGAVFLLPLQGWLTFALALSWTTWQLNR